MPGGGYDITLYPLCQIRAGLQVTLPETMGKSLAEIQALMAPDQGSKEPWYRRIEIPFYGRCYETLEEEDGDSGNQPQPEGSVTPQIHTSA